MRLIFWLWLATVALLQGAPSHPLRDAAMFWPLVAIPVLEAWTWMRKERA